MGQKYASYDSKSSPRPWGCFCTRWKSYRPRKVFPTPVGVFPPSKPCARSASRLPHARGGVSHSVARERGRYPSSPRPWGCFSRSRESRASAQVFPTPVGVFLTNSHVFKPGDRLPHARGGVSHRLHHRLRRTRSSPRPWGCFLSGGGQADAEQVFPTPVGVFLSGFIH